MLVSLFYSLGLAALSIVNVAIASPTTDTSADFNILTAREQPTDPAEPPLPPGYELVDVEWDVPGGDPEKPNEVYHMNGTIQEVVAYAKAHNPALLRHRRYDPLRDHPDLSRRADKPKDSDWEHVKNWSCNTASEQMASRNDIEDGIWYLSNKVSGKPRMPPGKACGRVSCSWGSAIWWCNHDANNAKTLGEWGDIGTAAWVVLNKCTFTPQKPLMATGTGKIAGGYVNYLQNWGAIVGRARC